MSAIWRLAPLVLAACAAGEADDSAAGGAGSEAGVGLRHFEGAARLEQGYEGWEAFRFTGELGAGEDLCRIRYELRGETLRLDCPDCLWAFDVESSGAVLEEEAGLGCAGLGVTPAEFDAQRYAYGYAPASGGYEDVLMYEVAGYGWYPVAAASWQEPRFSYDWPFALYSY
jgi:hypothetical protein